jgi:outer membrane lipoprotein-sorting protein
LRGLRSQQKRSLLFVNEHFGGERNEANGTLWTNTKLCLKFIEMKNIIFLVFLGFSFATHSQEAGFTKITDHSTLERDINNNSNKINSIKSDFVQEKKIDYLDVVIESKGKFWYKKESNLRWEYNEPFNYVITIANGKFSILDNGKVSVYDVSTNLVFKEINDLILSIAKGNMIKDNKFLIDAYENKTSYLLKLTPKDEKMRKFIQNTEVYISKEDLSATRVIMRESATDYTVISFVNKKLNDEIPDNIFSIK